MTRRDRAALVLALECLRAVEDGPVHGVVSARRALSMGDGVALALLGASSAVSAHETGGRILRARLALALRVLLRCDAWERDGGYAAHDLSPWDVTSLPPGHPYSSADETWQAYETAMAGTWYRRAKPVRPLYSLAPAHDPAITPEMRRARELGRLADEMVYGPQPRGET